MKALACGYNHSILISSQGKAYSFGDNTFGQLGLGDIKSRSKPTPVENQNEFFVSAAGGKSHSLLLTIKGQIYSFGRGCEGQLGDGRNGFVYSLVHSDRIHTVKTVHHVKTPTLIRGDLVDRPVSMICASHGGHGSFAVTAYDGCGWRWGTFDCNDIDPSDSDDGEELIGSLHMQKLPTPLPHPLGANLLLQQNNQQRDRAFSAPTQPTSTVSDNNNIIIDEGDSDSDDNVIIPTSSPSLTPNQTVRRRPSRRSASFDLTKEMISNAATVATAKLSAVVAGSNEEPISPGSSQHLCPGSNDHRESISEEQQISSNDPKRKRNQIVAFSAGSKHLVCITRAGEAWTLGLPGPHLGLGPGCRFEWINACGRMLLPGDILINGVACGENHTLLSSTFGKVFVCGDGKYGKLGNQGKDLEMSSSPLNAIPKMLPIGRSFKDDIESDAMVSTSSGDFTLGVKTVHHYLECIQIEHEEKSDEIVSCKSDNDDIEDDKMIETSSQKSDKSESSFFCEDDDEDWGLGKSNEFAFDSEALDADFNLSACSGPSTPAFGGSHETDSWKKRLRAGTKRTISRGTNAVGGVLFTTGGLLVNAVKNNIGYQNSDDKDELLVSTSRKEENSSPKNRTNVGDAVNPSPKSDTLKKLSPTITKKNYSKKIATPSNMNTEFNDSFNGLAGKARRRIMLAAGSNHSCVYMVENIRERGDCSP